MPQGLDMPEGNFGKRKRTRDFVPRAISQQGKQRSEPDLVPETQAMINDFQSVLEKWTVRMQIMQPKCNFDEDVFKRSLAIMFRYVQYP